MLAGLRRSALQLKHAVLVLDRAGDDASSLVGGMLDQVAVRLGLAIVRRLQGRLDRGPDAFVAGEALRPLVFRVGAELIFDQLRQLRAVLGARVERGVLRVFDQLLALQRAAEAGPVGIGLEHGERNEALVARHVGADERVGRRRRPAAAVARVVLIQHEARNDIGRQVPHRRPEQRDIDEAAFARDAAPEERRRDAAGQAHAGHDVAEGGALHHQRAVLGREHVRDAAARPVGNDIEAGGVGVRAALALAVPAGVDQTWVERLDVVVGDLEALAGRLQEARDEDVGLLDELEEDGERALMRQIEADAALAAVHLLHHVVVIARTGDQAAQHQATHGVGALGVLDLDHLSAPIGEHGGRRGHEAPLGQLDHLDVLQQWFHRARSVATALGRCQGVEAAP